MAANDAPGHLKVVQDFVNTVDLEGGRDELGTPSELGAWLAGHGLTERPVRASKEDLRHALELREALRDLMASNHAGARPAPDAIATLNGSSRRAPLHLDFSVTGAGLEPVASGVDAALVRLLGYVADAMRQGTWSRMKACQRWSCRWAFYDGTRNRSGKWCSMAVCGNRVKAETYRKRARKG